MIYVENNLALYRYQLVNINNLNNLSIDSLLSKVNFRIYNDEDILINKMYLDTI